MGLAKKILTIAAVAAVIEGGRRLATDPEAQQKAKDVLGKAGETAGSAAGKAGQVAGKAANKAGQVTGRSPEPVTVSPGVTPV
jgi:hypothetical protein